MKNDPKKGRRALSPGLPSWSCERTMVCLMKCILPSVFFPREIGTWPDAAAVRTVKTQGVSGKIDDFAHAFYILFHFSICSAVTKRKRGRPIKEQLTNQTISWGELKE